MALVVRAKVVDITSDAPKSTDVFLVDTNAWYWLFYAGASLLPEAPRPCQITNYPAYIKTAVASAAKLHCYALTFSELAHNVEKAE